MKKITEEDVKSAVEWLMKEKEGCVYYKTGLWNDDNDPLCIVFGWSGGFDEDDKSDKYADGEYRICCKVAVNDSSLQCDYESDFTMPYNEETNEVDDTDGYVGENFKNTAEWLNEQAERIAKEWNFE